MPRTEQETKEEKEQKDSDFLQTATLRLQDFWKKRKRKTLSLMQ